jgi:adenylate kinase family enzyme
MVKKKIHIICGPGSGKSYIAKVLSKKLNILTYDLDDFYWCKDKNTYGIKANPQIRDEELSKIIKKKEWIIEGVYGDYWTEPSFKGSDLIIILQSSKLIRNWRITRRFLKRKFGFEKPKKKETWRSFLGLFKWSWKYYKNVFPGIYKQIGQYENKIVKITKPRINVDEILKLTDSK